MTTQKIKNRLEYLRGELKKECISYGELAELAGLAEHIDPDDVQLLEAAGVPEHTENLQCRFVWFKGELLAVFMGPHASRRYDGRQWVRGCYQHVGQHGECYDGMQRRKRATPAEYQDLKSELESIGYNVTAI